MFQNLLFKSAIRQKMTFDQMHIGKFCHISCNTVLCRLFNCESIVFVCIYIRINIIIIIIILQKNIK